MEFTDKQKQLLIELVRDRHMALVDMAANAANRGDYYEHDWLADDYWNLGQILNILEWNAK